MSQSLIWGGWGKNPPLQNLKYPMPSFLRSERLKWIIIHQLPKDLICGERGTRAEAFAGEMWESPSVNIVLAAFPVLLQIDSLGVVSAEGKASFRPLCADILLKWDMNAPGENGIVR